MPAVEALTVLLVIIQYCSGSGKHFEYRYSKNYTLAETTCFTRISDCANKSEYPKLIPTNTYHCINKHYKGELK